MIVTQPIELSYLFHGKNMSHHYSNRFMQTGLRLIMVTPHPNHHANPSYVTIFMVNLVS